MAHLNDAPNLVVVEGDVQRSEDLQRCFDSLGGVDLVHHLAAINGTKWFHEAAMDVIDVNVNGTLATVRKAMEWGARFVLASSPEAYGENERMPLGAEDESRFPPASAHQRFSYGASKYLDEVAVHHAVGQGLDARIVRPFNGYGAAMVGDDYGQVVGMFFRAVVEQRPMVVHGEDGLQTRSFTHVDDLVEGFTSQVSLTEASTVPLLRVRRSTSEPPRRSRFERWPKSSTERWAPWRWTWCSVEGIPAIQTVAFPMRPRP